MANSNSTAKSMNKKAINKLRHGPSNIRQILRDRCRAQMRERREELLNTRRPGFHDQVVNDTLTKIIKKELSDLSIEFTDNSIQGDDNFVNSLMVQEDLLKIEEELMKEHEFMLQEYLKMYQEQELQDNFYIDYLLKREVICPICQFAEIKQIPDGLICEGCNIKLPSKMSVEELGIAIEEQLSIHNKNCSESPMFIAGFENDLSSINLSCEECLHFSTII